MPVFNTHEKIEKKNGTPNQGLIPLSIRNGKVVIAEQSRKMRPTVSFTCRLMLRCSGLPATASNCF
jgi:hypothetical protein